MTRRSSHRLAQRGTHADWHPRPRLTGTGHSRASTTTVLALLHPARHTASRPGTGDTRSPGLTSADTDHNTTQHATADTPASNDSIRLHPTAPTHVVPITGMCPPGRRRPRRAATIVLPAIAVLVRV